MTAESRMDDLKKRQACESILAPPKVGRHHPVDRAGECSESEHS